MAPDGPMSLGPLAWSGSDRMPCLAKIRMPHACSTELVPHDAVCALRMGLVPSANFTIATSILGSMFGASGFHGTLQSIALLISTAFVSVVVPSAHQIKDQSWRPHPAFAVATAIVAIVCVFR